MCMSLEWEEDEANTIVTIISWEGSSSQTEHKNVRYYLCNTLDDPLLARMKIFPLIIFLSFSDVDLVVKRVALQGIITRLTFAYISIRFRSS